MSSWRALALVFAFVLMESAQGSSYCVSKTGTRLRRAPTGRSEVTWRVPKFMPLQATGKRQNGWVEVLDVDQQTHWAPETDVTRQWSCGVVRVRSTRLRTGPGNQFESSYMGVLDRYTTFLDLGGEDGWTQIETEDGEKAWINLDHIWKPTRKTRMSFDD